MPLSRRSATNVDNKNPNSQARNLKKTPHLSASTGNIAPQKPSECSTVPTTANSTLRRVSSSYQPPATKRARPTTTHNSTSHDLLPASLTPFQSTDVSSDHSTQLFDSASPIIAHSSLDQNTALGKSTALLPQPPETLLQHPSPNIPILSKFATATSHIDLIDEFVNYTAISRIPCPFVTVNCSISKPLFCRSEQQPHAQNELPSSFLSLPQLNVLFLTFVGILDTGVESVYTRIQQTKQDNPKPSKRQEIMNTINVDKKDILAVEETLKTMQPFNASRDPTHPHRPQPAPAKPAHYNEMIRYIAVLRKQPPKCIADLDLDFRYDDISNGIYIYTQLIQILPAECHIVASSMQNGVSSQFQLNINNMLKHADKYGGDNDGFIGYSDFLNCLRSIGVWVDCLPT